MIKPNQSSPYENQSIVHDTAGIATRHTERPPRSLTLLAAMLMLLFAAVPADFVVPDSIVTKTIYWASTLALLGVIACAVIALGEPWFTPVLAVLVIGMAPFVTGGASSPLGGIYIALPIAIGIVASPIIGEVTLRSGLLVSTIVLLVESAIHRHWYSDIIGEEKFPWNGDATFRARGLAGHAVPAAFLATMLAVACLAYLLHRRRFVWAALVLALWGASLLATGTRSALTVSVLVLLPCLMFGVRNSRGWLVGACLGGGALVGVSALSGLLSNGASGRLIDFTGLSDSESGIVRSNALSSMLAMPNDCAVTCGVFGHGGRDLQQQLSSNPVQFGLSTVDNQYISLFWDFGIVGVLALVGAFLYGLYTLAKTNEPARTAGAMIIIAGALGALFFDILYIRITAAAFGVGIAMCFGPARNAALPKKEAASG